MERIIISLSSRNNVFALKDTLAKRKLPFEVVPTPVALGRTCGLSISIRSADYKEVLKIASERNVRITSAYIKRKDGWRSEYVKLQNLQ